MINKMKSRYALIILFAICFTLFTPSVMAEQTNVLDCLENEEDCEEAEEIEVIDGEQSEDSDKPTDLVGNDSFKASSLFFNMLKMVIALFFILALIYIILLFLRRRNKLLQHHNLLENLGGISLGQNKSLQLIRIGSHIYVVGVGEHVDLMLEITEPAVLEALLSEEQKEETETFLQNLLNKKKPTDKTNFMKQLHHELSKLQKDRDEIIHKAVKKDDEHE